VLTSTLMRQNSSWRHVILCLPLVSLACSGDSPAIPDAGQTMDLAVGDQGVADWSKESSVEGGTDSGSCNHPPLPEDCPTKSEPWSAACYDPSLPCDCPTPPNESCVDGFADTLAPKPRWVGSIAALPASRNWAGAWVWHPGPALPSPATRYLISLHGSKSNGVSQLYWWHDRILRLRECKGVDLGLIAPLYLKPNSEPGDYLDQDEIYAVVDSVLQDEVKAGRAASSGHIFHGHSRGSANLYSLGVLDGKDGSRWAGHYVANSGAWRNQPPPPVFDALNKDDKTALSKTAYLIYYGLQDHDPDQNGVNAQNRAADVVKKLGGTVKIVEEAEGCHSTFLQGERSDHAFEALLWALGE
jgi:hypothetical protein